MRFFAYFPIALFALSAFGQPVDNPYLSFYGNQIENPGQHWSNSIRWNNVVNINNYTGATMVEKFNAARDAVSDMGGGVVYFPGGEYVFENSIQLKSGVVVRGATPAHISAKDSLFDPPTRFEFPAYIPTFTGQGTPNSTAFKSISCLANTSNAGVVFLAVNKANINLASSTFVTVQTSRGSTSVSTEDNRNLIAFGIRSNNVASPYNTVPAVGQHEWQRFSSPFASNIRLYAAANATIANCRINDFGKNVRQVANLSYEQPGYLAQLQNAAFEAVADGSRAIFSYTDHHGISVNRKATISNATPEEEPGNFNPGLEVRDNWIFHTMRVGIICSGLGMLLKGNVIRDNQGKIAWLHPIGIRIASNNAATYENRGIDFGGWDVRVEDNDVQVFKHRIYNGPFFSVDGEGILTQECCGGTSVNGARIKRNKVNAYIGLWKMRDIMNLEIDSNNLGGHPIIATANTDGTGGRFWYYRLYNNSITNNFNVSGIEIDGNRGGQQITIANNTGTGTISAPCFASVENNNGFSLIRYSQWAADSTRGRLQYSSNTCFDRVQEFPSLVFNSPTADTTVLWTSGSDHEIDFRFSPSNGNFDSIRIYQDARLIAVVEGAIGSFTFNYSNLPSFRWISFMLAGYSNGSIYFSNIRRVKVDRVTSNSNRKEQLNFKVQPNPVSDELQITGNSENIQISVFDLAGKKQALIPMQANKYSLKDLKPGIYQLYVETEQGVYHKKIVKL